MEENLTRALQGFFNLTAKEKLRLVEVINEYFDSNDREQIRERHESEFRRLNPPGEEKICPCCGR